MQKERGKGCCEKSRVAQMKKEEGRPRERKRGGRGKEIEQYQRGNTEYRKRGKRNLI